MIEKSMESIKVLEVLGKVLAGKRIKPGSAVQYRYALGALRKFTEEWPGDAGLVNEWVAQLPKEWSDETVCKRFEMCLAAGNYMSKISGRNPDGSYRFYNVFKDAEKPKMKRKQRRYFKSSELVDCLKAARGEQEIALISTLIDSACRISELSGLRGRDVGQNFFICGQDKKTGARHYRLDARICIELKKLAGSEDGVIFKDRSGNTASVPALSWYVREAIRRAGITR